MLTEEATESTCGSHIQVVECTRAWKQSIITLHWRSGAALSLPLISETESMNGEAFVLIHGIFRKTPIPGIFAFFSFVSYILLDLS